MPDAPERTAREREAARLERERKRLERQIEYEPEVYGQDGRSETDERDGRAETDEQDGSSESEEHELELPSGTRRVTHLETLAAKRERTQPKVRRRPPRKKVRRRPPRKEARRPPRASQRSGLLGLKRVASVLVLGLAGALSWFLIELFQPFQGAPHGRVTVRIPEAGSSQIGDLLAKEGVISSSFFFELRATLAGERGALRSGVYHLRLGMSYGAVLTALTKAPPAAKVTQLTITEGRNRYQISALLKAQHVRGSYLAATRSSPLLDPRRYGARQRPGSLEGLLFPDTYQLVEPIRVSALVADQLHAFKQKFAQVNLSYARRKHLTPYDVLTIASLIEGETPTVHDRPLVSSVIYNRLADGMMLGLDSTTQYATGNFTRPLTVSQLRSSSPYNTRTHVGLPPTPINNPGLASIQAAANPARTRYLYFFGKPCQRGSVFATNYAQFLALGRRYQRSNC